MAQEKKKSRLDYKGLRWLVTTIAVIMFILRILYPSLPIDAISLGLIILALAPWLSPIIRSIEITGVGKIELQELKDQVDELKGGIISANIKAELATTGTMLNLNVIEREDSKAETELLELANKYVDTRAVLVAGNARTAVMTQIFRSMIQKADELQYFDMEANLRDKDPGRRLSAVAYAYAKPIPEMLNPLLDSVLSEVKPFNQYWGIQALKRIISQVYPKIENEVEIKFRNLLRQLKSGTDRYYEVKSIVDDYFPEN